MKMIRDSRTQTFTGYTAEKLATQFENAYIQDGVVYWKSNDRSPFEDMLTDFMEAGFISQENVDLTIAAKKEQDRAAIAEYIKAQANRSEEQIAEERAMARAAFGAGEKMVNIFTGETYYS
jgi:hypothetical protein